MFGITPVQFAAVTLTAGGRISYQHDDDSLSSGITLELGDTVEYHVAPEQLTDAAHKLRHGLGVLEWRRAGRTDGPADLINVQHVARVRPFTVDNTTNAQVQLWCDQDNGRLYLVDVDDEEHMTRVDLTPAPEGDPWAGDPGRNFRRESFDLVAGEIGKEDLGTTVGRPVQQRGERPHLVQIATYRHFGSAGQVELLVECADLSSDAAAYLGKDASETAGE